MKLDLSKIIKNQNVTKLEYQTLEYIIENIDKVMDIGVRGVAKANFTSTSTIMRLAKKLGYTGFVDMIYHIAPAVRSKEKTDADTNVEFEGVDLSHLLKYISEQDVLDCVELFKKAKDQPVFIYAAGFSKIVAEYLNRKLLILGLKSILCESIGIFENNINDIETFIVISKSGETREVLEKVKAAKEKGKKVISFTKEIENSISKQSDINFKIYDMHKLDDRNTGANTFFPNSCMLIEYLVYRYLN